VARRRIAVEFEAPLGDARQLAELVAVAAGLVDANSQVWTENFKPLNWVAYKRVRVNVEARK
jgi:hypothetical protein